MPPTQAGPAARLNSQRRCPQSRPRATSGAVKTQSGPRRHKTRAHLMLHRDSRPWSLFGWAAANGYTPRCAAFWPERVSPAPTNQPREPRANRRTGHRTLPGAGPRKGRQPSTRPTPSPATRISARQPRWPNGDFARWDSCHPTLGEPITVCRKQLDDEASPLLARVGSATRNAPVATRRRNARRFMPANGSHQLRGG